MCNGETDEVEYVMLSPYLLTPTSIVRKQSPCSIYSISTESVRDAACTTRENKLCHSLKLSVSAILRSIPVAAFGIYPETNIVMHGDNSKNAVPKMSIPKICAQQQKFLHILFVVRPSHPFSRFSCTLRRVGRAKYLSLQQEK